MSINLEKNYQYCINEVFDKSYDLGEWRFDDEAEKISLQYELFPSFLSYILKDFSTLLARFNDWQLAMGIEFLFSNIYSDYSFSLKDEKIPLEIRLSAIASLKNLYLYCFETRCLPALGHLSETDNELNYICFMFWDIVPFLIPDSSESYDSSEILRVSVEVMEYSLYLNNIACQESGLHGLSHTLKYNHRIKNKIDIFLQYSYDLDPKIISYANRAKKYMVI